MAGKFHPRVVHTESINRFRGIHDPDQKHNLPQEYVEGMSNLPSMRIGEARTRQGQELLESYDAGVNTGASLIRNRVIGEGGNLWAEELSRIVLMSIYDYAPPPVVVPYEIPDVIIDPADIDPLPDSVIPPITLIDDFVFPPTPPAPAPTYEGFVTVWRISSPQSIGFGGDPDDDRYSGTIAVFNHDTNERISIDTFSGGGDEALCPVMDSAGTYRIEIEGVFPLIDAYYINGSRDNLYYVLSVSGIELDSLGLEYAFHTCSNLISFDAGIGDFSHITSLKGTWIHCHNLIIVDGLDTFTGVYDLSYAWQGCVKLVNAPSVSHMTSTTTIRSAWNNCHSLVSAPDVSSLVNVESLRGAWSGCLSLSSAPDISALTNVTTIKNAWYGCSSLSSAPSISALLNLTTAYGAWRGCSSLTSAPSLAGLSKLTTIERAFQGCISLSTAPVMTGLSLLTSLTMAFDGCSSLAAGPDISSLAKVTHFLYMLQNCISLQSFNIPTNLNTSCYMSYMLNGSNNISISYIDAALNRAYGSRLANGYPNNVYMHLGTNKYSSVGQDAYNYLTTTAGWTIESGGLA